MQNVRRNLYDYNILVEYVPGHYQQFVDTLSHNLVWQYDDVDHGYSDMYKQECQVINCNKATHMDYVDIFGGDRLDDPYIMEIAKEAHKDEEYMMVVKAVLEAVEKKRLDDDEFKDNPAGSTRTSGTTSAQWSWPTERGS